jgi:protein-tyrosine phosphatase
MANGPSPPAYEILGAVKVKDGLFIGDELSSQDLEFVVANKVTHVINCAGRQVPNHWEPIGVVYLTYYWLDADSQVILDSRDVVANDCFNFIEEALEASESVLVHSAKGQSRSCCVLSAYMMRKFNWGLKKTMEFLSSRRPDLNLKPAFLQQLSSHERRLATVKKFSMDWSDPLTDHPLDSEELLLRNTYLNSQMGPLAATTWADEAKLRHPRLEWLDHGADDKFRLEVPSGGIKPHCKRTASGAPILNPILKWERRGSYIKNEPDRIPGASVASRPTTASSDQAEGMASQSRDALGSRWAAPRQGEEPQRAAIAFAQPRDSLDLQGGPRREMPAAAADGDARRARAASLDGRDREGGRVDREDDERRLAQYARRDQPGTPSRTGTPGRRDNSPYTTADARAQDRLGATPKAGPGKRDPSPRLLPRPGSAPDRARPGDRRLPSPVARSDGFDRDVRDRENRDRNPGLGSSLTTAHRPVAGVRGEGSSQAMNAFRSGGPVKARNDVLSDSLIRTRGPRDSLRPQTAPSNRPSTPDRARPSSPLRPADRRPPSPQRSSLPDTPGAIGSFRFGSNGMSASVNIDKSRRMLSSHMRRAPSPTPAFNRQPSPNKPRWRA